MSDLCDLPNVGKVLEGNLRRIGIQTAEQLRDMGAQEAFVRIRAQVDPGACVQMLYGIQGAIDGIPDKHLSADSKRKLREFVQSL